MLISNIKVGDTFRYENVQGKIFTCEVIAINVGNRLEKYFEAEIIDGEHEGHIFYANVDRII